MWSARAFRPGTEVVKTFRAELKRRLEVTRNREFPGHDDFYRSRKLP
jgi:hypothetical protein